MKAKLTRPALQIQPGLQGQKGKPARNALTAAYLNKQISKSEYRKRYYRTVDAGTVIEGPNAWRLVQLGKAVPDDAECKAAADMTEEQIEAAQLAGEALERGQATGLALFDADDDAADAALSKQFSEAG